MNSIEHQISSSPSKEQEATSALSNTGKEKNKVPIQNDKPAGKINIPLLVETMRGTLYVALKALNILYVPLFIYRAFERKRKCTPITDPILRTSAAELAAKIRRKEVTCVQVIQAYINRVQEINPLLNAVVDQRYEEALAEAQKVDQLLNSKEHEDEDKLAKEFPLLGLPLTVKGSLPVKGLKFASGSLHRKDHIADSDAAAVHLARKAGAIPLLVSNVPELCMNWETCNKLTGTTRNPHDITRTCGGSSGGEATLLTAGASVIGLGTDLAGSLRLPAHCCGIFAHKPSPETVSYDGHYPSCSQKDKWGQVFAVGPLSRYAGDLRLLMEVISIPEKKEMLQLTKQVNMKDVRVFYSFFEDFYWTNTNRHCTQAVQKVVDHFTKICDVKPKKINEPDNSILDLSSVELCLIEDIEDLFDGNGNGSFSELFRYATCRSKSTITTICCGILRMTAIKLSDDKKSAIKRIMDKTRQDFADMLSDNGVLLVPPYPFEAPKHGDVLKNAVCCSYMSVFNALGLPVTCCPVGVTPQGLPVGVQIVSAKYNDNLTISVAEELEKAFGGWIEPK